MAGRSIPFVIGNIYHVYNRGVEKRTVFQNAYNYSRFLKTLRYYQFEKPGIRLSLASDELVAEQLGSNSPKRTTILAYCLMPNHFHLLLRQESDLGISRMMSQMLNSYTKAFNTRFKRVGPLFQGVIQSALITFDEQLDHISRYIHLNPVVAGLVERPEDWRWSSYQAYRGRERYVGRSTTSTRAV